MDTQQGYEHLFAKAGAVTLYRGFSRVACVCVNRTTNTEKRACYLALIWALGSLPCNFFFQRLQMKLFLLNVFWEEESHVQENVNFTVPKFVFVISFCIEKCCLFLKGIIFYLTKYHANIPLLVLNLCGVM